MSDDDYDPIGFRVETIIYCEFCGAERQLTREPGMIELYAIMDRWGNRHAAGPNLADGSRFCTPKRRGGR